MGLLQRTDRIAKLETYFTKHHAPSAILQERRHPSRRKRRETWGAGYVSNNRCRWTRGGQREAEAAGWQWTDLESRQAASSALPRFIWRSFPPACLFQCRRPCPRSVENVLKKYSFPLISVFELEQKPFSIKKLFSVFEPETSSTTHDEAYKKVHEEYKQLVSNRLKLIPFTLFLLHLYINIAFALPFATYVHTLHSGKDVLRTGNKRRAWKLWQK